ncbi:hypothetical protein NBRC116494_25070 [Aurantivibrio plasticivorans]
MKESTKIQLLKQYFISEEYILEFINSYQDFIEHSLRALDSYKKLKASTSLSTNKDWDIDEELWDKKVKPNFLSMQNASQTALAEYKKNNLDYLDRLAGDFRGLSKNMDGIRESFMEALDASIKKIYFQQWKNTTRSARNIEKTINNWWKDSSILDENITGPIEEKKLLKHLKSGETP